MAESPGGKGAMPVSGPSGLGTPLEALYRRPGFLIRRANQIAVWLFVDEAAPLAITTTQYGALVILREHRAIDQIGLAKLLRIDKSTTALVVGKLAAAGYVQREADARDKRRNLVRITESGLDALRAMAGPAARARERLLAAFDDPVDAERLMTLLERYVSLHDTDSHASNPAETRHE